MHGAMVKCGENIASKKCGRCAKPLGTRNLHWEGGVFFHRACHEEGQKQLQEAMKRAEEQMRRFGFEPINATDYIKKHYGG